MMGILSQSFFFLKKSQMAGDIAQLVELAYHVQSSEYNPHQCMKSDIMLNAYIRSTQRERQEEAEGILHLTWNTEFQQTSFLHCSAISINSLKSIFHLHKIKVTT